METRAFKKSGAGFTLVELLIGVAMFGLFLTGVYAVLIANIKTYQSEENTMVQTQDMRAGLATMVWEMRMAGYDPSEAAGASILTANTSELRFTMNLNAESGDTDLTDANEDVRYAINASGHLGRETGGAGGLQPVVENVTTLTFAYFDENNTQLTAVPLSSTNRAAVRSVQVTVTSQMADADPVSGRREQQSYTTRVMMRNMGLQ